MPTPQPVKQQHFIIALEWCGPEFDEERRYILLERERIHRAQAHNKHKGVLAKAALSLVGEAITDWHEYGRKLVGYKRSLDRREEEIQQGWRAFKVVITNTSGKDDYDIKVRLDLEGSSFDYKKSEAERPVTPEGGVQRNKHAANVVLPLIGRFARTNIRLESQMMAAELSHLGPGDDAYVVNQVAHCRVHEGTLLSYRIESKHQEQAQIGYLDIKHL